jgi:primase-polymerase (primpol)-like protein
MMAHQVVVPDDLRERDQWVLWRREDRNGKGTKVPYQVSGRRASSVEPGTWTSFEAVTEEWRRNPSRYAGLGFVFSSADPFCGIDLDDSLYEDANVKPWARGIVERFGDTYMEISPSGVGLKIWVRGAVPANLPGVGVGDGQIEIYDHARYFAVTGRVFRNAPLEIEDHATDVQAVYDRLTGSKKRGWKLQPLSGGRIPFGQQHSTLVSIAGTLRRRRVCDEAIEACLQTVNKLQCERPGPPEHIARIVQSSRRWGVTA